MVWEISRADLVDVKIVSVSGSSGVELIFGRPSILNYLFGRVGSHIS